MVKVGSRRGIVPGAASGYSAAMSTDYCMVLTTFPATPEVPRVLDRLLDERLAACVQTVAIQSAYRWKGAIHRDPEVLALIKTTVARYPEVEARLRADHPYETPEIIRVPIAGGWADYLQWLAAETKS